MENQSYRMTYRKINAYWMQYLEHDDPSGTFTDFILSKSPDDMTIFQEYLETEIAVWFHMKFKR